VAPRATPSARTVKQQTLADLSQAANLAEAVQFRELHSVRDIQGEVLTKPSCTSLSPQHLGKYGVGLELYFTFLKYSMILFLFISLVSVWPMVMNFRGGYLMDGETNSPFDILTLANQDGPDTYEADLNSANDYIDSTQKYQLMTLIADVAYTVLFVLFLVFYRIKSVDIVEKNLESNLLPSDFAVEVKKLPKDAEEEEVRKHFEQFGEVVEVSLARYYNGKLMLYRYRSELSIKLGTARVIAQQKGIDSTTRIALLEKSIQLFDARLAKKNRESNKPSSQLPVNRAYILFNQHASKQICFDSYRKARKCCHSRRNQPTELQFRGEHPLKIKRPPEPSSILWENLEVGSWSRRFRRILVVICTLALMIMSVALMYWLKTNDTKMPKAYECRREGITKLSFTEAQATYVSESEKLCWCLLEGVTNIYGNTTKENYCDEYLSLWQKSIYIRVLSSLGIIAINFILKLFLRKISRFERVSTVTKQQQKIMFKIFLAMFVNTAFINLVVNANFQDFVAMQYVPFKEYMFDGDYDDFIRDWYLRVGSAVVVTMLISMVSPHGMNFGVLYPVKSCKILCCRGRRRTQYELNQLYIGPEHDIAGKTAITLNIIFSCFLYSGGIPLLNAICFVSLFLIYWIEKFLIVNYYRKPPVYDQGVNQRLQQLLPYSILLHCGFSAYMYGSDAVWPMNYLQASDGVIESEKVDFLGRIYRYTGITLILVMICTVCLSFFSFALAGVVRSLRRSAVGETKKPTLTYREAEPAMRLRGVSSYDIMENLDYRDLVISLNHSAVAGEKPGVSDGTAQSGSRIKVAPEQVLSDTQINNFMER